MSSTKDFSKKQKYLEYILPKLTEPQLDRMIATVQTSKSKVKVEDKDNPYIQLMEMDGLEDAKKMVNAMIADYRMGKIVEARGRGTAHSHFHAAFLGNPGCGKTICARLVAGILFQEGITKKASFVEATRTDLCGQYVGETAQKVKDVFKRAKDGTLFIDEAYSLVDGGLGSNNNYGKEAINEIIVHMENDPGTVVIFAGYCDRMKEFLDSNPGLRSRISYQVSFRDYTTEELLKISKTIAKSKGFDLTETALERLSAVYETVKQNKEFGNGRYVRNTIEAAIREKGAHIGVVAAPNLEVYNDMSVYSDEALFSLDESCIASIPESTREERMPIGFCM